MKIATWNVNSIRVRSEQLLDFLQRSNTDIVLLQETKCVDELFPREYFEDAGYNVSIFGQKSYNGVAILSKFYIDEVVKGNGQARYMEALIDGYTFASVYVPNGVAPGTESYHYKLDFLEWLKGYTRNREKFIIAGDFNIALTDDDVYNPKLWHEKICCTTVERQLLKEIIDGSDFVDCLRCRIGEGQKIYTWWDYRTKGFLKNNGLRLDYIFTTSDVVVSDIYVDTDTRSLDRPSDHAPVVMTL